MTTPATANTAKRATDDSARRAPGTAARCVTRSRSARLGWLAALVALAASPADAQDVTINLTGEVDGICSVQSTTAAAVPIDFGMLSDVPVGQQTAEVPHTLTVLCNDPDGGTFTVESVNRGNLVREGSSGDEGNAIGYTVSATGDPGIAFAPTDLSDAINRNFLGAADLVNGRPITLRFRANGVARAAPAGNGATTTTVFAGIYSDVVKVSVTAN